MTPSTVEDRIRIALADYLKRSPSSIRPEQSLRDDLGLDSMATIELLFRIEEVFDIQIPDEDLQRLVTIADVIAYVEGRLPTPAPAPVRARASTARPTPRKKPTAKRAK
ncbi:MAG TPA: acyl carrier protein [Nitrospiraceae bacterium]|nr:acyl carrier protein [Nitrospiraceae bacterium]